MPPPATRLLAPQSGFPNTTATVLTSNQNNVAIQNFYNLLKANNFEPTVLQMPSMVLWISGERVIAYFAVGVAVQINQRSQNLVQINGIEQQLRGDTVLRWVQAPTNWRSFFYHVQARQAIWEYMTADLEYSSPCVPCSKADLTGGQIRHCTPTRRCGERRNVVCARCLASGRPNLCMWPGDTVPTPLSGPTNLNQRPIHQLVALRDTLGSPQSIRAMSPIMPTSTPNRQAAASPLRLPSPMAISPRTPPIKRESGASTPLSQMDTSFGRMSVSPLPRGFTHDDILMQINILNIERNNIVYGSADAPDLARQNWATNWNQRRYMLSMDVRMLSQVYRNALGGYIRFGGPPKINPVLGPDPNPIPHTTTPAGSPQPELRGASVPPPVAPPPRGGNRLPSPIVDRITPANTGAGPSRGGGAPRGPVTPVRGTGGPRDPSAISQYFTLDPANLPPIDLAPGVAAADVIRLQNVQVPTVISPAMDLLFSTFLERFRNDPSRTIPTTGWNWARMDHPLQLDPLTGRLLRIVWREYLTQNGVRRYTMREFFWNDRSQRWERNCADWDADQFQRDRYFYERGG